MKILARENLKEESDAMVEQLRCVSKSRIGACIGSVSEVEMQKIETGIKLMLGL